MSSKVWKVYLALCGDGTFYCGIATDLERRLAQHNGKILGGAKYTRNRRPVSLLAFMDCSDKSHALKLEHKIKNMPRKDKLIFFQSSSNA